MVVNAHKCVIYQNSKNIINILNVVNNENMLYNKTPVMQEFYYKEISGAKKVILC